MKKVILTLMLAVLFIAPAASSQEEPKTNIETKSKTPQEESKTNFTAKNDKALKAEKDAVLATLEAAQNGQINIGKTQEQLAEEKKEIEKKKDVLVSNGNGTPAGSPEIKSQLKLLEDQKQLVEAKEMAIEERIEATEKVVAIIEQKIHMINNEALTLKEVIQETRKMRDSLEADQKEKISLENKLPLVDMELKAIEKELVAQNMLLGLRQEDKDRIKEEIKDNELRLETVRMEISLINERISFINVQVEIEKNFLSVLWEKRVNILKNTLLNPSVYSFDPVDAALLFILLVCVLFRSTIRRRSRGGDAPEEKQLLYAGVSVRTVKKLIFWGEIFLVFYFLLSAAGYHRLMVYLAYRVGLIAIVTIGCLVVHRLMGFLFQKIISSEEEGSKEKLVVKAFLHMASTILGWCLFFLGGYLVIEMLGLRYEVVDFVMETSQQPFFTLGNIKLSIWLILKSLIILWLFIVGSNLLDGFLRKNVYSRVHLDESVQYTFSVTIKYLMLAIGALIGLAALGVELGTLTVFAGTVGIGIGFGLQDIAKNFISGIVMLIERPVKIGDYIEVSGLPGIVKAIKARSTIVDTFDNISVIVPNAEFMNQQVVNWSYSDKITRVKISVGVAYGSNTELVRDSLLEAAKSHGKVLHHPEPYVWFDEFGGSSLDFRLFIWTNDPQNRFGIKSDLHYMIDRIFRERKITIAFPQRDIHVKSSDASLTQ